MQRIVKEGLNEGVLSIKVSRSESSGSNKSTQEFLAGGLKQPGVCGLDNAPNDRGRIAGLCEKHPAHSSPQLKRQVQRLVRERTPVFPSGP